MKNISHEFTHHVSIKDKEKMEKTMSLIISDSERQLMIEREAELSKFGLKSRKDEAKKKCEARRKRREGKLKMEETSL